MPVVFRVELISVLVMFCPNRWVALSASVRQASLVTSVKVMLMSVSLTHVIQKGLRTVSSSTTATDVNAKQDGQVNLVQITACLCTDER